MDQQQKRAMRRKVSGVLSLGMLASGLVTGLVGCAADGIEDRRVGQQLVCHKGKTLTVSNANSFVHLDHGDSPGPCPEEAE